MENGIDWREANPEAYSAMQQVSASVHAIDKRLKNLIEIRVSQINGCAFCLDMHIREARALGESQQRLDCLAGWRDLPSFDARERAALEWVEALTQVGRAHVPEAVYAALKPHFSEREIVDLTVTVALINGWNRMQIAMRRLPPER